MPKIPYQSFNFKTETLTIINRANQLIAQYAAQGFDLTLRQLYYQFVAHDLFPDSRKWTLVKGKWVRDENGTKNAEPNYKWLGDCIANGRLAGMIDWSAITDRTRKVQRNSHWDSPSAIIDTCADQFEIDKWARQPAYVEVWVEKDALIGVLEAACQPLDVPYYACRGYNSMSEIWNAGYNRFRPRAHAGKQCHVLYLGDHDPSGIDITRDVEERLNQFAETTHAVHGGDDWIKVTRLALNMDQVEQYDPPPNPTKMTDSRAEDYVEKFGETCWELDALDPIVIRDLVTAAIKERRDAKLWKQAVAEEQEHRKNLKLVSHYWDEAVDCAKASHADVPNIFEDEEESDEDGEESE